MAKSLQAKVYAQLEKAPNRRAIGFVNARGEISWRTWEEFYTRAAGYAAQLKDNGLKQGDVCILVLPSKEFCATALTATMLIGAVPLLIAPVHLPGAHSNLTQVLNRTIGKTKARIVICHESMANMQNELKNRRRNTCFLFVKDDISITNKKGLPIITSAEDDVAAMQLTSGTTGFPRVCVWKQKNILAALEGMASKMKLCADDICFNWTPLYHDMGLVNNFLLCLTSGVPLVMLSPQDFIKRPALWLRGLSETGSTITWSPNFGFAVAAQRVEDDQIADIRLDGVRAFWNAAERIHLDTMNAFHKRFAPFGVRFEALKANYGCAENVGGATFSDPDGSFVYEHVDPLILQKRRIALPVENVEGEAQAVSVVGVGQPVSGIRIKILSRTGNPLPDGHIGEIALETPSRMIGYLGQSNETHRALCGKLLRTGDLGYLRGKELFWVGRLRERITIRARKLDPSDFESILLKIPSLRPGCFVVFGVDDPELGTQRVVLATEARDSSSRTHREIFNKIRDQVFLHLGVDVSDIVLVRQGTLTKTSSGKRRHRHFRQLYINGKIQHLQL